jgi:cell division protein FtsW (lipid II flippase)/cell division protein FtsI/penicillin-binding protein 2
LSIPISPEPAFQTNRREVLLFCLAFCLLCLGALALWIAPAARLGRWAGAEMSWRPLMLLPVWLVCVWLVRQQARNRAPDRDPLLLPAAFLLAGWGVLLVWRLLPTFGQRQLGWLIVAVAVLVAILRSPADLGWLRRYRYLWLATAVLLTAMTLVFGTNPSGGEPRLWLGCCGLYFQPSEVLRLFLIVYLASFLSDRLSLSWESAPPSAGSVLAPLLAVWSLSVALVLVQRDLGTGSLFLGILVVMLYLASGRRSVLWIGAALMLAGGVVASISFDVVRARMIAWVNPWQDPIGSGYQIIQSTLSLASGGLLGQGPGLGAPGFVPAAHTDFVFSSAVEEWGLAGGLALIAVLGLIVGRGIRAAYRAADTFRIMLAAGLSIGLGLQIFVIVGGILRLMPLTGVTLPFISYGGSSLVTNFAGLALLIRISADDGRPRQFAPPLRNVQRGWLLIVAALALALGWWVLIRAPELIRRNDNPRRALAERYSPRGAIVDRQGRLLAGVSGGKGAYTRTYPVPAAAPIVGFDSARYGQAGLESSLDPLLRGEAGYPAWQVGWNRLLMATPPAGVDLELTVDARLQRLAMTALEGHIGAVVVIDPSTGDILAMGSAPTFDPSALDENWVDLVADPNAPLLNRSTQASYQPGTALAPLLYAWAVDQGQPDMDSILDSLSTPVRLDGALLGCARGNGAQVDTLEESLRLSCPGPWGPLAIELGPGSIQRWLDAFGLNRPVSIDLPAADPWSGEIPLEDADLARFGVGQAGLTVSPLQIARAFAALLNHGELPGLTLVQAQRRPGESWTAEGRAEQRSGAVGAAAASETLAALGAGIQPEYIAEAIAGGAGERLAWYFGAPTADRPDLLVVVVLEGERGSTAQAVGRHLLASLESSIP